VTKLVPGYSQNHLAVAGGCKRSAPVLFEPVGFAPTRYREVVLTVSKLLQTELTRVMKTPMKLAATGPEKALDKMSVSAPAVTR